MTIKDPYQTRFDMRDGYVGGPVILRGKSRSMFPVGGIVVPLVAAHGAYSAMTAPVLLDRVVNNRPVAGWWEDAWSDVGDAFEDAANWIGQAFEDAIDWVEASWDDIKKIADLGVTLLHAAALVCACTGFGAVVAGGLEAAAIGAQAAIDSADASIKSAIELGDMAADAAASAGSVVKDAKATFGKLNATFKIDVTGKVPTMKEIKARAASGDQLGNIQLATATLTTVFTRLLTLNPLWRGLSTEAVLMNPKIRVKLPPAVQALLVWAVAVKVSSPMVASQMTKAVGDWLSWKTETVNDITFRKFAAALGVSTASSAIADFSSLLPGYPQYKQFDATPAWCAVVKDMTPDKRTAEIKRIRDNYPEAEAVAAFTTLQQSAPSPKLATPGMMMVDPSTVNKLYQILPPPVPSVAYTYNPQMGGFNYDAAMKGSQAAHLSLGDKARWLSLLITDNLRVVDSKQAERLRFLSASARGMGASFGPPVVMGPYTPIDAAALDKAAAAFTADKGAQLRALASTLRNWAAGYDQRAAEYAVKLEADRLAAKKAEEDGQAALVAMVKQAAKESAESANTDTPRTREGIFVDLQSKTTKKGRFSYAGPIRDNQKTCVVSSDGTCDVGLWADA